MRKSLFIVLALFFIMSAAFPQRRALLVGISNYPVQSGWSHISSQNDLGILNDVLVQRGFSVDILSESDATFNNITDKLRYLYKNVQKRDTLLIHFSAHGQQMLALNDSLEPDGLDESIVPYDACSAYSDLYKGDKHLKDDVLSAFIDSIADAIGDGGLVVVSIDACHSDAMNRGVSDRKGDSAIVRGVRDIFDFGMLNPDKEDSLRNASQDTVVQIEKNGADVYYISACRSYEKNYECVINGIGYGSLSYCIFDLLNNNAADLEMKVVLDSLYLKMKKFGKQHMSTRNTIGYYPVEPLLLKDPIDDSKPPIVVEVIKKYWMAFSAMVIICALFLYLIWRKR